MTYHFAVPVWNDGDFCQFTVGAGLQSLDTVDIKSRTDMSWGLLSRSVTFMTKSKTADLYFQVKCVDVRMYVGDTLL